MKAMILAAGRGERLRPLTDILPKPLLLVKGKPLIAYPIEALVKAGVTEIVINVSYLSEKIQEVLGDGSAFGAKIIYSYEPEVLGTGGGVLNALPLLGRDPFIVMSADLWTDFPLQHLMRPLSGWTHLVMVDNPTFHPEGDFHFDGDKLSLEGSPKLTYASLCVLHPDLFHATSPGCFPLGPLLRHAIVQGKATGEHYVGRWVNVGTVEELASINEQEPRASASVRRRFNDRID